VVEVPRDSGEQVRENNCRDCATGDSFTPRVENASVTDKHTSTRVTGVTNCTE